MKEKLSRIRSPWRRRLVSIFLSLLVFSARFHGPRAYVHWAGQSKSRPLRIERLFFVVVFFGAMILFEPRQYIIWSAIWGAGFAAFVIIEVVRKIAPRKKVHWVRNQ